MLGTARCADPGAVAQGDQVAEVRPAGDDAASMAERTPSTPPNVSRPEGEGTEAPAPTSRPPQLRLAGTTAGPVTPEERSLLELRAQVVRAAGRHGIEAEVVREKLGRAGREDPMAVVRGSDLFERNAEDLGVMLSKIDARLAEIDSKRPTIEVDGNASALIRRP